MPSHSSLISGRGQRHDLSGPPILVTENVEDYRKTIYDYLHPSDVVLELGCAQGVTTGLIGEVVKEVIGIDKSEFQTLQSQRRNSSIRFYNMDAFDVGGVLRAFGRLFTVLYIDVSGNRSVGDVVSLCDKYHVVFHPRLIVVKCYKLKRLMGLCRVYPDDLGGMPFTGSMHSKLSQGKEGGRLDSLDGSSEGPRSHPLLDLE